MGKVIIIAAGYQCKNGKLGIGMNNKLPWSVPEDLKFFKEKTKGNIVVMGRKTYDSIGYLKDRLNIVLTNDITFADPNVSVYTDTIELFDSIDKHTETQKDIYIIGGSEIYSLFISNYRIDTILLTQIYSQTVINCDRYFPSIGYRFKISSVSDKIQSKNDGYSYRFIEYSENDFDPFFINSNEGRYMSLLRKVLNKGNVRPDRSNTGTISLFGQLVRYNISKSIPVFTTKRVAWKSAIEETLWMLSGSTDSNVLEEKGIGIWKGHTSREYLDSKGFKDYQTGTLPYGYGHQIRNAGADIIYCDECNNEMTVKGKDQLKYIENELKTNWFSRRILWNLWTANQMDKVPLQPCHTQMQFYVEEHDGKKHLSGMVSFRSNDLMLGHPFNVIGYSILIHILAIKCDMIPNELIVNIGDAHIYKNHLEAISQQIVRPILASPILKVNKGIKTKDYSDITIADFELIGYFSHPKISAKMAI